VWWKNKTVRKRYLRKNKHEDVGKKREKKGGKKKRKLTLAQQLSCAEV